MADLSGFEVSACRDVEFILICVPCNEPVDWRNGQRPSLGDVSTLAELVTAANRHTWEKHRHPHL